MPNFAYEVQVRYTNASNKSQSSFVVLAEDEADALRILIDADVIGSDMSTCQINLAPYTSVVYVDQGENGTTHRVPGRPSGLSNKRGHNDERNVVRG